MVSRSTSMDSIPFPSFESALTTDPDFDDGSYLFRKKIKVRLSAFDDGIWIVHSLNKSELSQPFTTNIQIQANKVISMQCNCEKEYDCEHTICALFYIREKLYYEDDDFHLLHRAQQSSEKKKFIKFKERIPDDESVGTNSFIDDAEYPEEIDDSEENFSANENPEEEIEEEEDDDDQTILPKPGEYELTLQQEFTCQICLEEMGMSIIFTCFSHSVCYACAVSLFEKAQEEAGGYKRLFCPTCGNKYFFRVNHVDGLKRYLNKSMKRMLESYKDEKRVWEKREATLKAQINDLLKNKNMEQIAVPLEKEKPLKENNDFLNEHFQRKKSLKKVLRVEDDDDERFYEDSDNVDNRNDDSKRRQDLTEEEIQSSIKKKRRLNNLILD